MVSDTGYKRSPRAAAVITAFLIFIVKRACLKAIKIGKMTNRSKAYFSGHILKRSLQAFALVAKRP
jgi:hypothetical protein